MIRNIVFDMGNVLIQWRPALFVEGTGVPEEDRPLLLRELFGSVEWIQMDRGTLSMEEGLEAVCRRLPERLHPVVWDIVNNWHQDIPPLEGVYELVKELKGKGYRIYLLSNTCTRFHDFRKNIPALEFFDGEFVSCDFHFVKPEPGIYLRFLEYFRLRPEECVFIDDDPRNIEAAVRCGMGGVIFHGDTAHLRLRLRELGVDAAC